HVAAELRQRDEDLRAVGDEPAARPLAQRTRLGRQLLERNEQQLGPRQSRCLRRSGVSAGSVEPTPVPVHRASLPGRRRAADQRLGYCRSMRVPLALAVILAVAALAAGAAEGAKPAYTNGQLALMVLPKSELGSPVNGLEVKIGSGVQTNSDAAEDTLDP